MSNEEKLNKILILVQAMGVLIRRITNDYYLVASYRDAVNFLLTATADEILDKSSVVEDLLYAAKRIIEKENV